MLPLHIKLFLAILAHLFEVEFSSHPGSRVGLVHRYEVQIESRESNMFRKQVSCIDVEKGASSNWMSGYSCLFPPKTSDSAAETHNMEEEEESGWTVSERSSLHTIVTVHPETDCKTEDCKNQAVEEVASYTSDYKTQIPQSEASSSKKPTDAKATAEAFILEATAHIREKGAFTLDDMLNLKAVREQPKVAVDKTSTKRQRR